jgi:hypothetical protein
MWQRDLLEARAVFGQLARGEISAVARSPQECLRIAQARSLRFQVGGMLFFVSA